MENNFQSSGVVFERIFMDIKVNKNKRLTKENLCKFLRRLRRLGEKRVRKGKLHKNVVEMWFISSLVSCRNYSFGQCLNSGSSAKGQQAWIYITMRWDFEQSPSENVALRGWWEERLIENLCKCHRTFVDTNSHYANGDAEHNEIEMRWDWIRLELERRSPYNIRTYRVDIFLLNIPTSSSESHKTLKRWMMNVLSAGSVYACNLIFRRHTTTEVKPRSHKSGSAWFRDCQEGEKKVKTMKDSKITTTRKVRKIRVLSSKQFLK